MSAMLGPLVSGDLGDAGCGHECHLTFLATGGPQEDGQFMCLFMCFFHVQLHCLIACASTNVCRGFARQDP